LHSSFVRQSCTGLPLPVPEHCWAQLAPKFVRQQMFPLAQSAASSHAKGAPNWTQPGNDGRHDETKPPKQQRFVGTPAIVHVEPAHAMTPGVGSCLPASPTVPPDPPLPPDPTLPPVLTPPAPALPPVFAPPAPPPPPEPPTLPSTEPTGVPLEPPADPSGDVVPPALVDASGCDPPPAPAVAVRPPVVAEPLVFIPPVPDALPLEPPFDVDEPPVAPPSMPLCPAPPFGAKSVSLLPPQATSTTDATRARALLATNSDPTTLSTNRPILGLPRSAPPVRTHGPDRIRAALRLESPAPIAVPEAAFAAHLLVAHRVSLGRRAVVEVNRDALKEHRTFALHIDGEPLLLVDEIELADDGNSTVLEQGRIRAEIHERIRGRRSGRSDEFGGFEKLVIAFTSEERSVHEKPNVPAHMDWRAAQIRTARTRAYQDSRLRSWYPRA
jgi:hypothetical protein